MNANIHLPSLHQYVFLHEALLDAVTFSDDDDVDSSNPVLLLSSVATGHCDFDTFLQTNNKKKVEDDQHKNMTEDDSTFTLCRQILQDPTTSPTHFLMTLQYLYRLLHNQYSLSSTGTILVGLHKIVLPFFLLLQKQQQQQQPTGILQDESMMEVLLDVAFLVRNSSSSSSSTTTTSATTTELDLLQQATRYIHEILNELVSCPMHSENDVYDDDQQHLIRLQQARHVVQQAKIYRLYVSKLYSNG